MDIKDKVAVVTGGASGIGRGIAIALAEKGATVVVADVEAHRASAVAAEIREKEGRASGLACDVCDEQQVESLAERVWSEFGRADILFNNAGVGGGGALLESTGDDLAWLFSVNVFGAWYGCKAFGRRFAEGADPCWIVNTGSEHSLGVPHLFQGFYTATKHAVLGLSDVLRRELPAHVGVSVLCPGVVATDFWQAGRNRPARWGGPEPPEDFKRSIMEHGMDPLEIGRRAVAGVEREDFLIVTHSHARAFAEERYREISEAFDSQAKFREGDERYDVNAIIEDLLG